MASGKTLKAHEIDMLKGSLLKNMLLFALPIAASSILQQLFNSVDVAVVGNFAANEAQAQAAVGCNGPVINLIINLFIGVSVGANVVISNYIGQNKMEKVSKAVHTAMGLALVSGVILLALGLVIARPVLELINTPEDVLPYAVQYLQIYSLGMPFIMVYNFGAAILRCIGDTRRPLYCLIISGFINAGLNMVLVIVFHLDVAGVAIATVISNVISAGLVWHFLTHETSQVRLYVKRLSIGGQDLERILAIGIPAGVQGMVFSIANVCIQSVLNDFGTDAVAGSAVILNYENITYFMIAAFGQTVVTFTSQNYGAGQYDRCKRIFRIGLITSVCCTLVLSWSFVLGRDFFISLFNQDPNVAHYAEIRMLYLMVLYFIINSYEIGGGALRGMEHSMVPAVLTIFGTCLLRLVWAYTLCRIYPSFELLMAVYPVSWIITGTAILSAYFIIRQKAFGPSPAVSPGGGD